MGHLRKSTWLDVLLPGTAADHLPVSVQSLQPSLQPDGGADANAPIMCDLQRLTALHSLDLYCCGGDTAEAHLSQQLKGLTCVRLRHVQGAQDMCFVALYEHMQICPGLLGSLQSVTKLS